MSEAVAKEESTVELHIPGISGEVVQGVQVFGIPVTNTILSTWVFMGILLVVVVLFRLALAVKSLPRLRGVGIDLIERLDGFFQDSFEDKKNARRFLPLLGGFFVFIFFANIFGLSLDWLNFVLHHTTGFLRPINSDMSTTIVMAVTVIVVAQVTGIITKGPVHHFAHYLFAWQGHSIVEKIINVPIGWLHFVGEFTRVLSLAIRLFANIFAGVILISVMTYLGTMIPSAGIGLGGIIVVPFWFFELFVAFLQAYIFTTLSLMYLKEAVTIEHHS